MKQFLTQNIKPRRPNQAIQRTPMVAWFAIVTQSLVASDLGRSTEMAYHHDTLAAVGSIVVVSQTVENLLRMLVTYVVQDGTPLSYERLMQLDRVHRKKTLGYFIREMQRRADFDPSVLGSLDRFLENRNNLVHHFSDVPGSKMESREDIIALRKFLSDLWRDLDSVFIFSAALLHSWTEQTGIAKGSFEEHTRNAPTWITDPIRRMSENMNDYIFEKE